MVAEYNALLQNNTWELVPRTSAHNPVGCIWVFKVKYNSDGSISRYKTRLVAKGYLNNMVMILTRLSAQ